MNMQKIFASLQQLVTAAEPRSPEIDSPPRRPPAPESTLKPTSNLHVVLDAITQACSQFVQSHVRPIADYQPDMGYAIRTIRLAVTPANARLVQDMSRMNPAARDMLVVSCVSKAVGSALISLDDFYGLTLDGDDAMLEGQVIKVLCCNDESFQPLHFAFDGEYKVIPFSREPAAGADDTNVVPAGKVPDIPDTPPSYQLSGPLRQTGQGPARCAVETVPTYPAHGASETRLSGREAHDAALAWLRVRDEEGEILIPVDGLPFTIGRQPEEDGYAVDEACQRVSRQHLRLAQMYGGSGFYVDNLATRKNGTYCQGQPQGERFVWNVAGRDHPEQGWLTLGGPNLGGGSLQIRLERPEAPAARAA